MADPQKLEPGTEFIRNPAGAIHDVHTESSHAALARRREAGWRFANPEEIKAYAEAHNLKAPDAREYAAHVKEQEKIGEKEIAAERPAPAPSAAEAGLEPVEEKPARAPRAPRAPKASKERVSRQKAAREPKAKAEKPAEAAEAEAAGGE
jgi:hypothetical protein